MTTINRSALEVALSKCRAVADGKSTIAMFGMVLVQASAANAWVSLTAASPDAQIALDVDADVSKDIDVCVELDRLYSSAGVPGDEVKLAMDGERLKVSVGRSVFRLPTQPSKDFPLLASKDAAIATIGCSGGWLQTGIKSVLPFCGGESHPDSFARGVCVRGAASTVEIIATNKASLGSLRITTTTDGAFEAMIPYRTAQAIAQLHPTRAILKPGSLLLLGDSMQFISKLLPPGFPDLSRTWPKGEHQLQANRAALVAALKSVTPMTETALKRWKPVALKCGADLLVIEAHGSGAEARTEVSVTSTMSFELTFDAGLLHNLLNCGNSENVTFVFDSPKIFSVAEGDMRAVAVCYDR